MLRQFIPGIIVLALSGGLAAAPSPESSTPANPAASVKLADGLKLCEKLAGTEREICARQAHENQQLARDPAVGATPGSGVPVSGEPGSRPK